MSTKSLAVSPRKARRAGQPVKALAGEAIGQTGRSGTVSRAYSKPQQYVFVFHADPMERVRIIKSGIPASTVDALASSMSVTKDRLLLTLGIPKATVSRKVRENKPLSADEGSRVLGVARLVGQVQAMVQESGNPEGFNAAEWVAQWLEKPLSALGGQRPAEFMDTAEGQQLVADLVARMQSGAYA